MFPPFSSDNLTNHYLANPELFGENAGSLNPTRAVALSYLPDPTLGKFRRANFTASCYLLRMQRLPVSSLIVHISQIIPLSTKEEMIRTDATLNIAVMQDILPKRDRPEVQLPG